MAQYLHKLGDDFTFLGALAKIATSGYYLRHVCLSVRQQGKNWFSQDGFHAILIAENYSKFCH